MNKKKMFLIILTLMLFVIIGTTYAFLRITTSGNKRQVITSGEINVVLEEDENNLMIENAMPMYDEVGRIQNPYEFKIINQSNYKVDYILRLKDVTDADKEKLSYEDVKYQLVREKEEKRIEKLSERKKDIIDSGEIKKNSEISYEIRIWIDSAVTENERTEKKCLSFQVEVEIKKEAKEEYTITYHTGTTETIEPEQKTEGENYKVTSRIPTQDNRTFLGWSTREDGEVEYQVDSIYQEDDNLDLYAIWGIRYLYNSGDQFESDTAGWKYTRTFFNKQASASVWAFASETCTFATDYIEWKETDTTSPSSNKDWPHGHYGAGYIQTVDLVNLKTVKTLDVQYTVPTAVAANGVSPYTVISVLDDNNSTLSSETLKFSSAINNVQTFSLDVSTLDLSSCRIRLAFSTTSYPHEKLIFRLYTVSATY